MLLAVVQMSCAERDWTASDPCQLTTCMSCVPQMLFYIWRAQYPLFMAYHAMLVDGTGSGGELPPEKADRILVRPWHTQRQPLGMGLR